MTGRSISGDGIAEPIRDERISAQLDQQLDHLGALVSHGEMQRCLMVFIAAHAAGERRRIRGYNAPHLVAAVLGHGGKDVVPGAAAE